MIISFLTVPNFVKITYSISGRKPAFSTYFWIDGDFPVSRRHSLKKKSDLKPGKGH